MLMGWFTKRFGQVRAGRDWHHAILRQARQPEVFARGWVADTLDGRFHMLTVVSVLVLRRLRGEGDKGRALADRVYRAVFSGIEHALREEGVGDSSIARKMRKRGEDYFGLARALDQALTETEPEAAIAGVLVRNGVTGEATSLDLARHLTHLAGQLEALSPDQVLDASCNW